MTTPYQLSPCLEIVLDLSKTSKRIEIGFGLIRESGLVTFLEKHREITQIDFSNHTEIDNITISRFRKYLPNLTMVRVRNTALVNVTADQVLKYFEYNIPFYMDNLSFIGFYEKCEKYLNKSIKFNTPDEVRIINSFKDRVKEMTFIGSSECTYLLENSKIIISIVDKAFKKECEDRNTQIRLKMEENIQITQEIINNWEIGLYKDLEAYKRGPKTLSDVAHSIFQKEVYILYIIISILDLWDSLGESKTQTVLECHPAIASCGHSGASFSCTLARFLQKGMEGYHLR